MAKGTNKKTVTNMQILPPVDEKEQEHLDRVKRNFAIIGATLRDGIVNYSFEVVSGVGTGLIHHVTNSKGICKESLKTAFSRLAVHMAAIDKVFALQKIDVTDIDKHHTDEITYNYLVGGFKISKNKVTLSGLKFIDLGSIKIETPKILIDELSSYQWYNELKTEIENCCEEVAKYSEGNYDDPELANENEDQYENENQKEIFDEEMNAE